MSAYYSDIDASDSANHHHHWHPVSLTSIETCFLLCLTLGQFLGRHIINCHRRGKRKCSAYFFCVISIKTRGSLDRVTRGQAVKEKVNICNFAKDPKLGDRSNCSMENKQ